MANSSNIPRLIDKFWESIPSAWRQTRSQIRIIAVEKYHMSEEQFQVLRRIRKGSASVSALADAGGTSRSAVSKTVDAMVRRGLIIRNQDLNDRRNIPLTLTSEGLNVLDAIYTEAEDWLSTRFDRLGVDELDTLLRGMEMLQRAFLNS